MDLVLRPLRTGYAQLQERELSKWVWAMSLDRRFRWLMLGIDPADILRTVDLARQGRLVWVDGDRENVVPGIDLHAAFDTHTWGSMYITVRNDLSPGSGNSWVFAGDLVYAHENLRGADPTDPQYVPVGLATGSQFTLIMTSEEMIARAGGDHTRVVPVHEEGLRDLFPSRIATSGLRITELALADGESSRALRSVADRDQYNAGTPQWTPRTQRNTQPGLRFIEMRCKMTLHLVTTGGHGGHGGPALKDFSSVSSVVESWFCNVLFDHAER